MAEPNAENYVLRTKDAAHFVGVSLFHFRRLHALGHLPAPIRLSERRLGWRLHDLDLWLESRRELDAPHAMNGKAGR
jgi:prophage regulatory protein